MIFLQIFINGIILGGIYLLISIGLSFTYALLRFPNFSHAELITIGAYTSLILCMLNLDFKLTLAASFATSAITALLIHILAFNPMIKLGMGMVELMIVSIGIGIIIRHVIQEIWGAKIYFLKIVRQIYELNGIRIADSEILILIIAFSSALFLHLLLTKTKIGIALRASIENTNLALSLGVNIDRLTLITWIIGGGLAGIGGSLFAFQTRITPYLGWEVLISAFASTILGGIGSIYGVIFASLLLGLCESFGLKLIVSLGLSSGYRSAIPFLVILVSLLIKPKGLTGGRV